MGLTTASNKVEDGLDQEDMGIQKQVEQQVILRKVESE